MSNKEPNLVIQKLQASDRDALRLLFQEHYKDVCKAVFRYVKNKATVEDLAQDVFMKLWEKRETISINSSIGAYLYRMGVNEAISYLRKQQRQTQNETSRLAFADTSTPSVEDQYLHAELDQRIVNAIDALPPRCQLIFKLSRFEGLSYREIAEKLELSIKTVENQMGKALRVLRERMKDP